MRIDTKLNDIDRQTDRLKKYINFFAREIKADKIILTLICCIYLFVIAIVIGFFLPDKSGDDRSIYERLTDDHGITNSTAENTNSTQTNLLM